MQAFFVTIPHSGLKIPPEASWLKEIPLNILNCDVDFYVDELYAPTLNHFQIPSIIFEWHRYAVDANRFSKNISPLTVKGAPASSSESPSDVHWHHTTKGDILIQDALSQDLHQTLIHKYHQTFHQKIENKLKELKKQEYKETYHLDLHSMPSQGLDFHQDSGQKRPDIVLGTNEKKASSQKFIDLVLAAYKQAGFQVELDWPYKGGAITQIYGQASHFQNVIQIEINRSLYMDEQTKKKTDQFKSLQKQLKKALSFLIQNIQAN